MGGKSGSKGNESQDYYGTFAVAFGAGPAEYLWFLEMYGKEAWPNAAPWVALTAIGAGELRRYNGRTWKARLAHNSAAGNAPPNPNYWEIYVLQRDGDISTDLTVPGWGECTIYWGTADQDADPYLQPQSGGNPNGNEMGQTNPAFRNTVYIVFKSWYLGREVDSVGNVRAGFGRAPNTTLVPEVTTVLQDGNCNPVAMLAEVLTSPLDGFGLSPSLLDDETLQSAAIAVLGKHEYSYCSPIIDSFTSAKDFVFQLSQLLDLWLRWDPTYGRLEVGLWAHGAVIPPEATIGRDFWEAGGLPKVRSGDAPDWQTVLFVKFRDRDRRYKAGVEPIPHPMTSRIIDDYRSKSVSVDWITRRTQAARWGAEYMRTMCRPQATATGVVRPFWRSLATLGTLIQIDVDVVPGGLQILQSYRVTGRTIAYDGKTTVTLEADETQMPVPYTPGADTPPVLIPQDVPAITAVRILQAPQRLADGENYRVIALCQRPDLITSGVIMHFSLTNAGVYQAVTQQRGWAVKATLRTDLADTAAGPIQLTVPAQADTDILQSSPTANEAADNAVLCFLMRTAAGQVDENVKGYPILEICSVSAVSKLSSTSYDLTVDRERLGTSRQSFVTATTEVWIVSREALTFARHEGFKALSDERVAGGVGVGYFKLQPFTLSNTRPLADCATVSFRFPPRMLSAPQLTWIQPTAKTLTYATPPGTVVFEGTVRDSDSNLSGIEVTIRPGGGEEVLLISKAFQLIGDAYFKASYNFTTAGTYVVTVRARDITGLVGEDSISVEVQGGTPTVATPYFGSWGDEILGTLSNRNWTFDNRVFGFCQTVGAALEWNVSDFGGAAPGSGWITVASGSVLNGLTYFPSWRFKRHRLHLRAKKAGLADSVVAYCDMG